MLFSTPKLGSPELAAVEKIESFRKSMRYSASAPLRWYGLLRRNSLARAIRGSNSIEGYLVTKDDALAAVERQEPTDTDQQTWQEILGYRDAMTYVLQLSKDPNFQYSEDYIRSLHFLMLKHDLIKNPGNWRPGPVYVRDESTEKIVYDAPDRILVEPLMKEFVAELRESPHGVGQIVKASMAHLNFVMIHPFSDGNGRMARCLQTLVLSREGIIEPDFCSVEEYLGRFTRDYYDVLAVVGQGKWNPQNDAMSWLRFMLKAHFQQGELLSWRMKLWGRLWDEIEIYIAKQKLPKRMTEPLFNTALGHKIRNEQYRQSAEVSDNLASRDLQMLVSKGIFKASGNNRGRSYLAGTKLLSLRQKVYEPFKTHDPFDVQGHLAGMEP
jgi:Fic family protein